MGKLGELYFYYGVMGANKSYKLLTQSLDFTENNIPAVFLNSVFDTRKSGKIYSRRNMEQDALTYSPDDLLYPMITRYFDSLPNYKPETMAVVFIDEAQFLTSAQVLELSRLTTTYPIRVFAYGLRSDYLRNVWEGAAALFVHADIVEELRAPCQYCAKKENNASITRAKYNLRLANGVPVFTGEQIKVGFEYVGVCAECYEKARLEADNVLF